MKEALNNKPGNYHNAIYVQFVISSNNCIQDEKAVVTPSAKSTA